MIAHVAKVFSHKKSKKEEKVKCLDPGSNSRPPDVCKMKLIGPFCIRKKLKFHGCKILSQKIGVLKSIFYENILKNLRAQKICKDSPRYLALKKWTLDGTKSAGNLVLQPSNFSSFLIKNEP